MTKRRRSYALQKFDYSGIVAEEANYDDGFDKWEDMVFAFKGKDKILINRSHGDRKLLGFTTKWDLDSKNKNITIYFNKEDLDEDVEFDKINNVSVEWEMCPDDPNKIIGINHISIGKFKQKCKEEVCNITKQRGDEPDTTTDVVPEPDEIEEPEVPEETTESDIEEKSELELIKEQNELLKEQIEEMSKVKAQPEPEPEEEEDEEEEIKQDKKIKLGFQDKLKHKLPTEEKDKVKTGFTKWKWV